MDIDIRNVTKSFRGGVTALDALSLEIPTGMFGLLGSNGAGKTTLMRILAGLLEPTSGTATLDGEDILSRPERVRARLGYLPQEFGFYPHLSGAQMLLHLLKLKGRVRIRLRRLLPMADCRRSAPPTLSKWSSTK